MLYYSVAQLDGIEDVPPLPGPICQNGNVFLGYGSSAFVGLGFSVIVMLVFIEVRTNDTSKFNVIFLSLTVSNFQFA